MSEADFGKWWNDCECPGADESHPALATAIPEGWQLVPKELTEDMYAAYWKCTHEVNLNEAYKAMLAAAPKPGEKE